jgi:hypothetical protein
MQRGPIRHEIDRHEINSGPELRLRIVRRETSFDPAVLPTDAVLTIKNDPFFARVPHSMVETTVMSPKGWPK